MPHLPRQSAAHRTPPLLLPLPRTRHLQPPRPPTLVKHENVQREHIQRVYLLRPHHRTNNAPLPIPIPSNFQREQTDRKNEILPTAAALCILFNIICCSPNALGTYGPGVRGILPAAPLSQRISTLGPTFACACEAMGPRDMGERVRWI